ncbi:MAG: hypothetical protein HOG49_21255 [Candidatus Scalindua sp.]|nr:hypothetical protein [Candidatus Scalindua sp.]
MIANKENPLKGMHPIEFDEKGYVTCFKIYDLHGRRLVPPFQGPPSVESGCIESDRASKELHGGNEDTDDGSVWIIFRGIHVSIIREESVRGCKEYQVIVPVRCHKEDLVASSIRYPDAVFTKIFLEKEDYEKAISNE